MVTDDKCDEPRTTNASHRLPTLSASQALAKARDNGPRTISTGLTGLDLQLMPRGLHASSTVAGLPLGQITEVYGPPGSGKTGLALQICASAVQQGGQAIWLDTASPLPVARRDAVLNGLNHQPSLRSADPLQHRVRLLSVPTLSHLLALLLHSPPHMFKETRVIIVDTVSSLFEKAYAKDERASVASEASKWASTRKFAVMGELIRGLGKLSIMHNMAVVLLCQCATKLRPGAPAVLLPSISGHEWESGVSNRILLYKDWPPVSGTNTEASIELISCHYAAVCKLAGAWVDSGRALVPFTLTQSGLLALENELPSRVAAVPSSPARPAKRAYVEIADSDAEDLGSDDDYGWMDEDDAAAAKGIDVQCEAVASIEPLVAPVVNI